MLISLSVVLALFAVLVAVVWWIAMAGQFLGEGDPVPPDDPWMLEHGYRLAHHYREGMGPGSVDHALQEAAIEKRDARDTRLAAIHLEHTEPFPRMRLISATERK
jgi:hypothetical protein